MAALDDLVFGVVAIDGGADDDVSECGRGEQRRGEGVDEEHGEIRWAKW